MHKKRAVIVSIVVMIILIALVFILSDFNYRSNSKTLVDALKQMRSDPEAGLQMCDKITVDDFAQDCYSAYLSAEIENIISKYSGYEDLKGNARRDAAISILNEISDRTDSVCSLKVMMGTQTCSDLRASIDTQRKIVLVS